MSTLIVVGQRPTRDVAAPWIIDGGRPVPGREGGGRIDAVRAGLERHPRAVAAIADADDAVVSAVLGALHEASYLQELDAISSDVPVLRPDLAAPGMEADVPVSAELVRAAREGVRTAISAAVRLSPDAPLTYALCRPPGHHAGPGWFGGYCYLNTGAAAARTLLDRGHGSVGILDLDLHYPNGTAAVVAGDDRIHLRSIHAAPVANAPAGVATPRSPREAHIAFHAPPTVDAYVAAVEGAATELAAVCDAVVVSLGYDTVGGDPHGHWDLSPADFRRVGAALAAADRPLCVVQEGGYGVSALADCSLSFATGLLEGVTA